ncbi:MAG: glycosyltransferase family 4 protein [Chloroflexi bacterium]|nr:glycosyltransferase family 4 protein [Chloroflexota bacterium]
MMNAPEPFKQLLRPVVRPIRRTAERAARAWRAYQDAREVSPIRRSPRRPGEPLHVSYAHLGFPDALPGPEVVVVGGAVKYQYLHRCLPHAGWQCDVLYAVSSNHYAKLAALLGAARSRGIPLVWNQNGTFVPFAYGPDRTRWGNAVMAPLLHGADYVLYQSEFARLEADHFLGKRQGPAEILYNAVDTRRFSPSVTPPGDELVLLAAGSHNDGYRLPAAIRTLASVARRRAGVRLIVAGLVLPSMRPEVDDLVERFGLGSQVELAGPYPQQTAPAIFRRAHILLHTQYNDVCPTVVLEAMACGLPVVYSHSGGTPELVGDEAGYGVPTVLDWEAAHPPDPDALADGILRVAEEWPRYSQAARRRAATHFDLECWIGRHVQVFEMLVEAT